MDQSTRGFLTSALIAALPATIGVASAAQGLTDDEMDRVTGGNVANAIDTSDFFAARAEARGVIAKASAEADDFSAKATGSAQTIAPDSHSVWSRAETVSTAPPPPQPDPVRIQMADLWDGRMGGASLPFSWLR
jgi:hypothetical protein